jgi:DNA-binding NarL/FixJ family response regulator
MLEKSVLDNLNAAMASVGAAGDAAGWGALQYLAKLQAAAYDFEIDFRSSEAVGAPVILATPRSGAETVLACLTPRQRDVARLIARGLSNRQIASQLAIALPTVKDHVHAVLVRLGCERRGRIAARLGSIRS